MPELEPIYLSLKLSFSTSFILLILGTPLAYFLSQWKSKYKSLVESLVSLPIILPPTVIGFYLLYLFSPTNAIGSFFQDIGIQIPFTFGGILIASIIYSLPFFVQPALIGFDSIPKHYWDIGYTLGKSRWEVLSQIVIPNMKNSLLTGFILSFAHTMGEFGVILMIGGNIPGVTRVASLAIYSELESLNYESAHIYSLTLLIIAVIIIFIANYLNKRTSRAFD